MDFDTPLLEATNLKKHFPIRKTLFGKKSPGVVKAVDDVSFILNSKETLGLIGESGCGKTTISRVILGLIPATAGEVRFMGETLNRSNLPWFRKNAQMVFQDPYSSLDPRMKVKRIIEEPLRVHTKLSQRKRREISSEIIEKMGLSEDSLEKYPHEFSGGQRQRIGIARALVLHPKLLICDEPLSALDVSIQSSILNLLRKMQQELGLSFLFISHDMNVISHISDRIAVMYLGKIVEFSGKRELFSNTMHPYSKALISAIPTIDPNTKRKRIILSGDPPSPVNPPPGCPFQGRCNCAKDICRQDEPKLRDVGGNHYVACHLY